MFDILECLSRKVVPPTKIRKRKDMGFETKSKCAVRACAEVAASIGNLCDRHQVPGVVFEGSSRTYVVSSWYTEHEGTRGIIVINDFALGDLFGGREGFRTELARQGFTAVRLLATPGEFAEAREKMLAAPGNWSGPWSTQYPWESAPPGLRKEARVE